MTKFCNIIEYGIVDREINKLYIKYSNLSELF